LQGYFDEGPDPPAGTPGFENGLNVLDNINGPSWDAANVLVFHDAPNAGGTYTIFLASKLEDGSVHKIYEPGVTFNVIARLGGDGNVEIVDITDPVVIPEPGVFHLVVVGIGAMVLLRMVSLGNVRACIAKHHGCP
jgi:hypothetical protein